MTSDTKNQNFRSRVSGPTRASPRQASAQNQNWVIERVSGTERLLDGLKPRQAFTQIDEGFAPSIEPLNNRPW